MSENQILTGVRILDFSWVLAGPYATRLLADFGAEVVKVHPLLPEAEDKFSRGYFNNWNRNKLGITLNMGKPEGREIARKLIRISDVVVENFSPRVMTNWGLDYPELKALKPDIILLSLSVMGHSGPWRDFSGFGPTVQTFSGLTYLTAYPGQPPLGIGFSYADHIAGLNGSLAILEALENRRRSGRGQYIDLSETEAMASLLSEELINYTLKGQEAKPAGNDSSRSAPHGIYRCRGEDRWCAIAVSTAEEWAGFKRVLGKSDWTNSKKFTTLNQRILNKESLDNLVQAWTQEHTVEEVVGKLQQQGVPAGPVNNAADLARDPQLQARQFFREPGPAVLGNTITDADPVRLSESPAEYRSAAPLPGQHNQYVYGELLGFNERELERLKEEKVI